MRSGGTPESGTIITVCTSPIPLELTLNPLASSTQRALSPGRDEPPPPPPGTGGASPAGSTVALPVF
jgi:hypothetical protein